MYTYLLLFVTVLSAPDAVQRADRYLQTPGGLRFHYTAQRDGGPKFIGSMTVEQTKRLFFTAVGGDVDYVLSITESGLLEMDRKARLYEELPYEGQVTLVKTGLADPRYLMPSIGVRRSLSKSAPGEFKVISGAPAGVERVQCVFKTDFGPATVEADVNKAGQVVKLRNIFPGRHPITWTFSKYETLSSPLLKQFVVPIPDGYAPFSTPRDFGPISQSLPLPDADVRLESGSRGRLLSLVGNQTTLLAYLRRDCEPSAKFVRALPRLQSVLGNRAKMLIIWDKPGSSGVSDENGSVGNKLSITSTPTFILVTADRKVEQLWMGFDPKAKDGILFEVGPALDELAE